MKVIGLTRPSTLALFYDVGLAAELRQLIENAEFDGKPFPLTLGDETHQLLFFSRESLDGSAPSERTTVEKVTLQDEHHDVIVTVHLPRSPDAMANALVQTYY